MIARIKGEVAEKLDTSVVVEINGIGYEIVVPQNMLLSIKEGQAATFYIAENIKEDEYTLFGFASADSRQMYYKLTSVNGVGPKAAISILSAHEYRAVQQAILDDNVGLFSSISGIGKKTAQRIILELKGKLVEVKNDSVNEEDQAYQALVSLGYSAKDAQMALKDVDPSLSTQDRIKLGLKGVKK
ncbi:MAG: Holliday junction branch migration protein RuvA [Chitinophagia bacterium]|nr:Holliday junction branch migration protein RuvA [Chitinophagia bacterium]